MILHEDGRTEGVTKSLVDGHWRTNPDGQMSFVNRYQDSRIPHIEMPHPDFHGMSGLAAGSAADAGAEPDPGNETPDGPRDAGASSFKDFLRGSQVVDYDGHPQPVYPVASDGPLGPGLYFKSQPEQNAQHPNDPNVVPDQHRAQVLQAAGNVPDQARSLFAQHGDLRLLHPAGSPEHEQLSQQASQLGGPASPCYLSIRQPLLTEDQIPTDKLAKIVDNDPPLGHALARSPGWPTRVTGSQLIDSLGSLGRGRDITHIAQQAGYDGLGSRQGGSWVAFTPEQVKATGVPIQKAMGDQGWAKTLARFADGPTHTEMVPVEALKRLREYDRERTPKGSIPGYLDDLTNHIARNGIEEEGFVEYHHPSRTANLGEGNHRLAAAIRLGWPAIPMRVAKAYSTGDEMKPVPGYSAPDDAKYTPGGMKPSDIGLPVYQPEVMTKAVPEPETEPAPETETGFHGTAEKWLPKILEQGLRSTHETGIRHYGGNLRAKQPGVYMTSDPHRAARIASGAAGRWRGNPAMIVARVNPNEATNDEDFPEYAANNLQDYAIGHAGHGGGWPLRHRTADEVRSWMREHGSFKDLTDALHRMPDEDVMSLYRVANEFRAPRVDPVTLKPDPSTDYGKLYRKLYQRMDEAIGQGKTWPLFRSAAFPGRRPETIAGAITWPRIKHESYQGHFDRVKPAADLLAQHRDDPVEALRRIEQLPGFTVHHNPLFEDVRKAAGDRYGYHVTSEEHLPDLVAPDPHTDLTPHYPAHPDIEPSPVSPEPTEFTSVNGHAEKVPLHDVLGRLGIRNVEELHNAAMGPKVDPSWRAHAIIQHDGVDTAIHMDHELTDAAGAPAMGSQVTIQRHGREHPHGEHIELHRGWVDVDDAHQGKGIGSAQNKNLSALANVINQRTGLPVRTTLGANLEHGGYYWGKLGMKFDTEDDRESLTAEMLDKLDALKAAGHVTPGEAVAIHRGILKGYTEDADPYYFATLDHPQWPRIAHVSPTEDGKDKTTLMPVAKHLMLGTSWSAHAWHGKEGE